jgi:hypothetical protein
VNRAGYYVYRLDEQYFGQEQNGFEAPPRAELLAAVERMNEFLADNVNDEEFHLSVQLCGTFGERGCYWKRCSDSEPAWLMETPTEVEDALEQAFDYALDTWRVAS